MKDSLPFILSRGEQARLFPVLSTTSKEGRATSIVLACLAQIEEFGRSMLKSIGQQVGKRSKIDTYTEVVFAKRAPEKSARPDGFIVVRSGQKQWRALVEAKIGKNELSAGQIERYRALARDHSVDCVITISNQFASAPHTHPVAEINKSRSKIPVYHWSWMKVLTEADLLLSQEKVEDTRSAGVRGFVRMPKEWSDANKLVSSGGNIAARSALAESIVYAWHQETRDLSLILSRMTETAVTEKLSRKYRSDPVSRLRDDCARLSSANQLGVMFEIRDAAAPVELVADLSRRCIDVGMTLRAPENKVSSRARTNWVLRQIKGSIEDNLYVRLLWPGRTAPSQFSVAELRDGLDDIAQEKGRLAPHSFCVFQSERIGARFAQQTNFVAEIERIVPQFYREVGAGLSAWKRPAPRIKRDRADAADVSTEALLQDSEDFGD